METSSKINIWDYIKPKAFAQQRKLTTTKKGLLLNERRYFSNDTSDKVNKELIQHKKKKIKKWAEALGS